MKKLPSTNQTDRVKNIHKYTFFKILAFLFQICENQDLNMTRRQTTPHKLNDNILNFSLNNILFLFHIFSQWSAFVSQIIMVLFIFQALKLCIFTVILHVEF